MESPYNYQSFPAIANAYNQEIPEIYFIFT